VPEQLLYLPGVLTGPEQLGGEHMPQRVRRDALVPVHARSAGVTAEGGGEERLGESPAEHTKEQCGIVARCAGPRAGEKEWHEAGVDRHDALAPALGFANTDQTPVEIDVVEVQAEQRAAQAAVGEQGEQQTIALELGSISEALMRMRGLEPPPGLPDTDLNRARLPIPPHPRAVWSEDIAP
jgi:hypothetical protein